MKKVVARKIAPPYRKGRSDSARDTSGKLKKWRIAATFLTAAVGLSALVVGQVGTGGLAAALADPLSMFSARSPGGRSSGELAQTKPARHPAFHPSERVKSVVRDRPAGPGGVVDVLPEGPSAGELFGPPHIDAENGDRVPDIGPEQRPYSDGRGPEPIFPSQQLSNDSSDVETSIPEPATWLTLIIGIFIIGARARSGRWATLRVVPLDGGRGDDQPSGALDTPPF